MLKKCFALAKCFVGERFDFIQTTVEIAEYIVLFFQKTFKQLYHVYSKKVSMFVAVG